MKSLFKRVLASATGSVMLLSQMAATAVNTTAADATVLDKAWLTEVPTDGEVPALDDLAIFVDGEAFNDMAKLYVEQEAEEDESELTIGDVEDFTETTEGEEEEDKPSYAPAVFGESNWNDKFETAIKAAVGDGDKTVTIDDAAYREKLANALKNNKTVTNNISEASVDAIIAAIGAGTVTVEDGYATAKYTLSDAMGKAFGDAFVEYLINQGGNFTRPDGVDVTIDWSGYDLSGELTVDIDFSKYDKTASYEISFTDGKGKKYSTLDELEGFAAVKFLEAMNVIVTEGAKQGVDLSGDMAKFASKGANGLNAIKEVYKAIGNAFTIQASAPETYTAYLEAVKDSIKEGVSSARFAGKILNVLSKAPATLSAALTSEKVGQAFDVAIDALKSIAGENVKVDLSPATIQELIDETEGGLFLVGGYTAAGMFMMADDQNEDVAEALKAAYADTWAEEGYEFVSVESSKVGAFQVGPTSSEDEDAESEITKGDASYDMARYITRVDLKKIQETTTTTTTTTEETTTTTTTEGTGNDSTTTTTTTEGTGNDSTTTTTTTEGSGNDSTTTTTTTEGSGDDSTTTTTTTTQVSLEFVAEGIESNVVYWSEEDTTFDVASLIIGMNVYEDGKFIRTVEVTNCFTTVQKDATDFDFEGFGLYGIQTILLDETGIASALTELGYDAAAVLAQEKATGSLKNKDTTGKYYLGTQTPIYLVLRGDMDLNNSVDMKDVVLIQKWFNFIVQNEETMDAVMADNAFKNNYSTEQYIRFGHYAADVHTGNGLVDAKDATCIQKWYNWNVLNEEETPWDDANVVGAKVTPLSALHGAPLEYETIATE